MFNLKWLAILRAKCRTCPVLISASCGARISVRGHLYLACLAGADKEDSYEEDLIRSLTSELSDNEAKQTDGQTDGRTHK